MNNFKERLDYYFSTLSLSQVSIKQTTEFILNHMDFLYTILDKWEIDFLKANDIKKKCLLYLADNMIITINNNNNLVTKLINLICDHIKILKNANLITDLAYISKIWSERSIINNAVMNKIRILCDEPSIEFEEIMLSKILNYIKLYHKTFEMYITYQKSIDITMDDFYLEKRRERFVTNKSIPIQTQFLIYKRKKYKKLVNEISDTYMNCQYTSKIINEYFDNFKAKCTTILNTYNEYKNYLQQIIQIKNKIESISNKFENTMKNNLEYFDLNLVIDMDIDKIDNVNDFKSTNQIINGNGFHHSQKENISLNQIKSNDKSNYTKNIRIIDYKHGIINSLKLSEYCPLPFDFNQ